MVAPGTYHVALTKVVDGVPTQLTEPVSFQVVPLNNATLATDDREALVAFQQEAADLMNRVRTAGVQLSEIGERLGNVRTAIEQSTTLPISALADVRALELRAADLGVELNGDGSVAARQFETPPSISDRVGTVLYSSFSATSAPTGQQREQLQIATRDFADLRPALDSLLQDVAALEARMKDMGGPYLSGQGGG